MQSPKPYYIVAIPEGAVMAELLRLQKLLSQAFMMYTEPYPLLHLTVGVLSYFQEVEQTFPVLQKISSSLSPFSVKIQGESCFKAPLLSVGVHIQSHSLNYLAGKLEGSLLQAGFSPHSFLHWDFHISLVNPIFASRRWSNAEFTRACRFVERHTPSGSAIVSHLELWSPTFPPLNILGQFPFAK